MSLTLAMIANMWLLVAYISIAYCLLKPVIAQARPAYNTVTIIEAKFRNSAITYARRKEYYGNPNP